MNRQLHIVTALAVLLANLAPGGAAPTTIYGFGGDRPNDHFGFSVSGAGDVNGDGFADLIVGAPGDGYGSVRVLSGIDGSTLHTINGRKGLQVGHSVSGAGDVNGDDFADLIVGAGFWSSGNFYGSARVVTVDGVYDWQGASSDPGDAANWRLMNTTATPGSAPAGRDVMRIGPAANPPLNSGTIDIARTPETDDHLGYGVFYRDISYAGDAVSVALFQAGAGDANGDGYFNFGDLILIFSRRGKVYGDGDNDNADWLSGDFTGDADFSFDDLIAAFSQNGSHYGSGQPYLAAAPALESARIATVAEPSSLLLLALAACTWGKPLRLELKITHFRSAMVDRTEGIVIWWARSIACVQAHTLRPPSVLLADEQRNDP